MTGRICSVSSPPPTTHCDGIKSITDLFFQLGHVVFELLRLHQTLVTVRDVEGSQFHLEKKKEEMNKLSARLSEGHLYCRGAGKMDARAAKLLSSRGPLILFVFLLMF